MEVTGETPRRGVLEKKRKAGLKKRAQREWAFPGTS
jgi:hypothetical protein